MSGNPLMQLFDVDLNSDRHRVILSFLLNKTGRAIARLFPTRAAACYSALVTGFALAFVPIAKAAPVRVTLMTTLAGAGLVAVAAHELEELQADIDEAKVQKECDRQLRLFADTEAKNKIAETNLLRHGYELDKSLPIELQQAISMEGYANAPTSSDAAPTQPSDRAAFDAAIATVQTKPQIQPNKPEEEQLSQPVTETTTISTGSLPTDFTATMAQIAQRLVSMTVVGVPGAGKGMFVSNLLRQVRQHHPSLHIFVMEGKGDAKEAGYWQGTEIRSIQGLDETPIALVAWINGCLADFKAIAGPKLLIFDEVTYLYKVWQTAEKESFEDYIQYKIGLSSMGDSLQNYIWEIGQVSNAKDLGVTAGIRSLFKPIAIVSNHDRRAANALLGTKFVPLPEEGKKAVMAMCDRSDCGRAVYDYVNDCWQPMPPLPNLSGFDRDTRSFAQPPASPASEIPKPPDVRADLERLLAVKTEEPTRAVKRFGLSAVQISEVQKRLAGLPPGAISSVKRIRENSRLLRDQGVTQAELAELFAYLSQTGAIEWLASDQRDFKYLGGL